MASLAMLSLLPQSKQVEYYHDSPRVREKYIKSTHVDGRPINIYKGERKNTQQRGEPAADTNDKQTLNIISIFKCQKQRDTVLKCFNVKCGFKALFTSVVC